MIRCRSILFAAVIFLACANFVIPCTTFVLIDGEAILFGRNLDWFWGDGLAIINRRGISKTAFLGPPIKPAKWISKYGSVTFNQFGREYPMGGMNEVGLVVETMRMDKTAYAPRDDRPSVFALQWVQFQLDTCGTVAEVLRTDKSIHIVSEDTIGMHFLVCDAAGDVAVIELLDGKMVIYRGDSLSCAALTNDTYESSLVFLDQQDIDEGKKSFRSLRRFAQAEEFTEAFKSRSADEDLNYAFESLRRVSLGRFTKWSIVYNVANRQIHYRTQSNDQVRVLSLDDCDFAPADLPTFVDINSAGEGDVSRQLQPLTEERHKRYLVEFFDKPAVQRFMGNSTANTDEYLKALRSYHVVK